MKKLTSLGMKCGTALASLALGAANSSTQATCVYCYHQPKVPAALKNLKK
ncbi:MAG: cyclic lactone autoinducer peptide [Clostridia bacterium]|nr:cyclic lactone autoinducer peptide [Clostridia bacterium]